MMMRLASMGTALAGKRVVISITPAEFYRPHLEQPSYRANFSRVQATTLAFDTNIPYGLRRAAAQRMLQYPTTIADDPILRWGLESLADRSAFGRARYAAVLPLGLLQGAALRLADHWQFVAFVYRHPELHRSETVVPVPINWAKLEAHVDADALHQNQNNPFGFRDDYWTENGYKLVRPMDRRRMMPVVPLMVNGLHHEPRNIEWRDFALLLDIVRSLGGQAARRQRAVLGPVSRLLGRDARRARAVLRRGARPDLARRRSAGGLRRSRRGPRVRARSRSAPQRQGLGPVRRGARRLVSWRPGAGHGAASPSAAARRLFPTDHAATVDHAARAPIAARRVLRRRDGGAGADVRINPPAPPPFIYQGF